MEYDSDKVDEMVLALLFLSAHGEPGFLKRAWKDMTGMHLIDFMKKDS